MARGTTLGALLTQFRHECRLSGNPAHHAAARDGHLDLLRRTQQWLYEDTEWPHLRTYRLVPVQAGQRFYSPPDDISLDRITEVEVMFGAAWVPLKLGIDREHMSRYDSDLGQRAWPVERWQVWEDEQIELWPIPDANATPAVAGLAKPYGSPGTATTVVGDNEGMLKVWGIRRLRPLVADSDRADLDDRLIVLFAAAEYLVGAKAPDAQAKMAAANKLYLRLRGKNMKRQGWNLAKTEVRGFVPRGPIQIARRTVPS